MPINPDLVFDACFSGESVEQPIADESLVARGSEENLFTTFQGFVNTLSEQNVTRAEKIMSVVLALGSGGAGDSFPLVSPTSDADAFDALMDLFNLAGDAWSANGNIEVAWGVIVLGSTNDTLPKPGGSGSIPDRMAQIDGADSDQSSAVPTEAELESVFDNANSAAGITWTGANPNSQAIQKYGAFTVEGATYSTLHGLNADGTNDPGESGNAAGTANEPPAVVDQYLFGEHLVGTGFLDWLRMVSNFARVNLDNFQMDESDITWEDILPPPSITVVTGSGAGEIDVSWVGDNIYWGDESENQFEVYYGLTSDDVTNRLIIASGGLKTSPKTISGLLPGTTYFVAVSQNKVILTTANIPDIPGGGGDYFLNVAEGPGILSTIKSATSGS